MNKAPAPDKFEQFERDVEDLRRKIREGSDPKAIATSAALFHVEAIARILRFWNLFESAITLDFCSGVTFNENVDRMCRALSIVGRLTLLLARQVNGLLTCAGGPDAIAVQSILQATGNDPNRQQLVVQTLLAYMERTKSLRRKRTRPARR